jgi:hypothetical protein
VGFDHNTNQIRLFIPGDNADNVIVLGVADSVELEKDIEARLGAQDDIGAFAAAAARPSTVYVGIFAGATKPTAFQRRRPVLAALPPGYASRPAEMRAVALGLHHGSYAPRPQEGPASASASASVRHELALRYIIDGHNSFDLAAIEGRHSAKWTTNSVLVVGMWGLYFHATGSQPSPGSGKPSVVELMYESIDHWGVVDNGINSSESGIDVFQTNGDYWFFSVSEIRYLRHTLEFFWNKFLISGSRACLPGSTNGRTLLRVHTLSGERDAPPPPAEGNTNCIIDKDGALITESAFTGSENSDVARGSRWSKMVVHQGWMTKKVGSVVRAWSKQYFVIYSTPQGHFLVYYRSCQDSLLFTDEILHRNFIDLSKVIYIRPVSAKQTSSATPPFAFDLVTADREWTLCAESSQDLKVTSYCTRLYYLSYYLSYHLSYYLSLSLSLHHCNLYERLLKQLWMKILARAIDEDVAIIPDDVISFSTKPIIDPLGGILPAHTYAVTLTLSAMGIALSTPESQSVGGGNAIKEVGFWVYHDLCDWSVSKKNGKYLFQFSALEAGPGSKQLDFAVRTMDAPQLCTSLEFFVEKYMSYMTVCAEAIVFEQAPRFIHSADAAEDDAGGPPECSTPESEGSPVPGTAASAPPGVLDTPTLTMKQRLKNDACLHDCMLSKAGALFDDGILQIAANLSIDGAVAKLSLFYRNHGVMDVNDLTASIYGAKTDDATYVLAEGLSSFELSPCGVSEQSVEISYKDLGHCEPLLVVSYTNTATSRVHTATMRLPVTASSFMAPWPLDAAEYAKHWVEMTSTDCETTEVFYTQGSLNPFLMIALLEEVIFVVLSFSLFLSLY